MIFETIQRLLAEQFTVEENAITMDTRFEEDLNADSLDAIEFMMALEEEFNLDNLAEEDVATFKTVADVVDFVQERIGK